MKAPKTTIKLGGGSSVDRAANPVLTVVPAHGNLRSQKERAKLVYLWVGDDNHCFGHVSGAVTLRKLAYAILAETGRRKA